MAQHGLTREARAGVLWIAFDRPRAANAIDRPLAQAFAAALAEAATDASVGAVVMTGTGDKAFSAGIDIKNPDNLEHAALAAHRRGVVTTCLSAIVEFDKPLVAALNGHAVGLGCMLALLADRVIAAQHAGLSLPEIDIGIPTFLGISILQRAAGSAVARDFVLTGRRLSAAQAHNRGLIADVAAPGALARAAQVEAATLAAKPLATFALDKHWLARGLREDIAAANAQAEAVQPQLAAASAAGRTTTTRTSPVLRKDDDGNERTRR
ncbi:MAG: enoyl-CoA hydratase/isomerase family protein [Burkholderiales bacterium]|nr:enoyl-CoA hydratase/isomerase family protein [Burkholderiales bacterium]